MTGAKKAERALSKFFVKESRPTDVAALLKKTPPQISLSENNAQFDLGGESGLHYGSNYIPGAAKGPDGKPGTAIVEDWMKDYREALRHLNQKHYLQAEFQFKSGVQKYKTHDEGVIFSIGLAKTYQEMKEQTKLRDVIAALVKSQENVGPPTLRPINAVSPVPAKDKKLVKAAKAK